MVSLGITFTFYKQDKEKEPKKHMLQRFSVDYRTGHSCVSHWPNLQSLDHILQQGRLEKTDLILNS